MNRKETNLDSLLNTLQEKVVIPDVVQERAEDAFAAIRREVGNIEREERRDREYTGGRRRKYRRNSKKKFVLALIAAVLAFGTACAAAVYIRGSKSLTEGLRVTQKQQVQMQEAHMTKFVEQSSVDQGITVTAMESITDQYFTHIAFRVEGYQVAEGVQPDFETIKVMVGGREDINYSGAFYNGIVAGADGTPEYADGTPIKTNADGGMIENYTMADGSMEFQITLFNMEEKGFFINQPIHVELHNLGTVAKAAYSSDIEGTWTFDWTLEGSPEVKKIDLNVPLGDSGATVSSVELSPISMMAEYEFVRQSQQEIYQDENGQEQTGTTYVDPPELAGVRMKDGTVYPNLYRGPGGSGYESEGSAAYRLVFAIERILDVDQVESLLFRKPYTGDGAGALEERYYIVPIG